MLIGFFKVILSKIFKKNVLKFRGTLKWFPESTQDSTKNKLRNTVVDFVWKKKYAQVQKEQCIGYLFGDCVLNFERIGDNDVNYTMILFFPLLPFSSSISVVQIWLWSLIWSPLNIGNHKFVLGCFFEHFKICLVLRFNNKKVKISNSTSNYFSSQSIWNFHTWLGFEKTIKV